MINMMSSIVMRILLFFFETVPLLSIAKGPRYLSGLSYYGDHALEDSMSSTRVNLGAVVSILVVNRYLDQVRSRSVT